MGAACPYATDTSASRLTLCPSRGIAGWLGPRDGTLGPKRQAPSAPPYVPGPAESCGQVTLVTLDHVPRGCVAPCPQAHRLTPQWQCWLTLPLLSMVPGVVHASHLPEQQRHQRQ